MAKSKKIKAIKYKMPDVPSEEGLEFRFHTFAFRPVKVNSFTNFFKDVIEWKEKYKALFGKIIPSLQGKKFSDLSSSNEFHFHKIDDQKQLNLYKKVIKEIAKQENLIKVNKLDEDYIKQHFFDSEVYQLGIQQYDCMRLVGILHNKKFEILFFDVHHMIYQNINYNDKDYLKYKFSPFIERDDVNE